MDIDGGVRGGENRGAVHVHSRPVAEPAMWSRTVEAADWPTQHDRWHRDGIGQTCIGDRLCQVSSVFVCKYIYIYIYVCSWLQRLT